MQREGFRRSVGRDGDVGGQLIIDEDRWRVLISPGQHRVVAAAVLGLSHVPVRIGSSGGAFPCRRLDVTSWPQVRRGLFTTRAALAVFDRAFEGLNAGIPDEA
jgi:hypothetical protein